MAKRRRNEKVNDETLIDVVEAKENAQEYIDKNKTWIMGLVAAVLLIGGGYIIYKYLIKAPKEKTAKVAIFKAEQQFQRDSFALALENPGGGNEGFLDIIDNYPGTQTSNLAKLYAGISYLNVGRYEDAIEYLNSHAETGTYSPILKNGNLGDAYSEMGDFDKAITHYKKATTVSEDALLTPYYLYKLGLLLKRNGDNAGARTALEKIKNDYPDSDERTRINAVLASLN